MEPCVREYSHTGTGSMRPSQQDCDCEPWLVASTRSKVFVFLVRNEKQTLVLYQLPKKKKTTCTAPSSREDVHKVSRRCIGNILTRGQQEDTGRAWFHVQVRRGLSMWCEWILVKKILFKYKASAFFYSEQAQFIGMAMRRYTRGVFWSLCILGFSVFVRNFLIFEVLNID